MIITIAAVLMVGFITVAIVGVREAQAGVRRLEAASGNSSSSGAERAQPSMHWNTDVVPVEALQESRFTSSLLALSKVPTPSTRISPVPGHAESSSLESVLQPQSKTPVRES